MSMIKPFFLFSAIVVALISSARMASAEQRATDAPPSQQSKLSSVIWDQARANGTVRVVVDLNVPGWTSKKLSKDAEFEQRQKIADAQKLLLGELAGTHYKINRQFETVPSLAIEVGPDALAVLERSPRVLHVSEDAKLSPSIERIEVIGTPERKETSK